MKSRTVTEIAVAGVAAIVASLFTWITGTIATVTGEQPMAVSGTAAAPAAVVAGAIVLLGAFALMTSRRGAARVILVVIAVVGLLGIGTAAMSLRNADEVLLRSVTGAGDLAGAAVVSLPLYLYIAALAAASLCAVLGLLRVGSGEDSRTRFDAAATASTDPRTRAMDDWDALTAGDDPSGEHDENR